MGKGNISQHQRETFYSGRRKLFPVGRVYIQLDILSNKLWKIGKINQSAKDRAGEALKKVKNYVK